MAVKEEIQNDKFWLDTKTVHFIFVFIFEVSADECSKPYLRKKEKKTIPVEYFCQKIGRLSFQAVACFSRVLEITRPFTSTRTTYFHGRCQKISHIIVKTA